MRVTSDATQKKRVASPPPAPRITARTQTMSTPTTPSPRADLEKRLLSPTANSSSSKKPKIAETPADTTAAMSASTAVHTTSPVTNPPGLPSLQIKLLSPTARAPTRGSEFAAGYDMYASRVTVVPARGKALVETDVAMAVPAGTYGRIAPRSGLASKNFIDVGAGVIDADYRGQVKIRINQYCHDNKIAFVSVCTHGLFGSIFCDFGDDFAVVDPTGETAKSGIVAGVDEEGLVTALDESRHGLEDGDYVTFSEIQGMEELNGAEFKIEVKGKKVCSKRPFDDSLILKYRTLHLLDRRCFQVWCIVRVDKFGLGNLLRERFEFDNLGLLNLGKLSSTGICTKLGNIADREGVGSCISILVNRRMAV